MVSLPYNQGSAAFHASSVPPSAYGGGQNVGGEAAYPATPPVCRGTLPVAVVAGSGRKLRLYSGRVVRVLPLTSGHWRIGVLHTNIRPRDHRRVEVKVSVQGISLFHVGERWSGDWRVPFLADPRGAHIVSAGSGGLRVMRYEPWVK